MDGARSREMEKAKNFKYIVKKKFDVPGGFVQGLGKVEWGVMPTIYVLEGMVRRHGAIKGFSKFAH